MADAEHVVIAYGEYRPLGDCRCESRPRQRHQGWPLLKLITIWPFPGDIVKKAAAKAKTVIVPEMNYGQLIGEVERYVGQDRFAA